MDGFVEWCVDTPEGRICVGVSISLVGLAVWALATKQGRRLFGLR